MICFYLTPFLLHFYFTTFAFTDAANVMKLHHGGLLILLLAFCTWPSVLSDLSDPKPRHSRLFKTALQHQDLNDHDSDLWTPLRNQGWKPCFESTSPSSSLPESSGYIQVFLDGGLNQQRMGICDAVAVAKILNATLVIPYLEVNPVWKDTSTFMDIFDVDHFINVLKDDISIVRALPDEYMWSTREYYASAIRSTRVKNAPLHASANWYLANVSPVLDSYGIAAISPFSHRLAFNNMPVDIQRLRCKVNFEALVFIPHITSLGDVLVNRLRYPAVERSYLQQVVDTKGAGKFVALHLRFDKDMAAHSACDFGGGKAEKKALARYRQAIWQGRVLNSRFTNEELRNQGRCPLTPEEIGLLLAALGFDNSTRLYLASHKVYGGEARISALRKLFPQIEDKKSLASAAERAQIKGKASLSAAVDYYVSMHSDIFVSASPGNMHNAVVGHRTYLNLKTIRPNMALLGQVFMNKSMSWSGFQEAVIEGQRNRLGEIKVRKAKQSIYTYPVPDCVCQQG
ncbi:O-fucosyltransferase 39-like [Cynara cardunculus var. scolymus]|uniref:O-fucosyltransferase family protein n=1 Tax=Cynara cardunculus var. scolymus TaxID=59895 RepID=A0A103YGH1_CYNCS|nr:O-fucosyltransferase 39-like [Cynara cardunculus var. scolymus]KVI08664.1 GDP-fucose protein O-fucosyltransferase [Cynara cardunculus var. scolymus]